MSLLLLQTANRHSPFWDLSSPRDSEELPQDTEFSSRDETQSKGLVHRREHLPHRRAEWRGSGGPAGSGLTAARLLGGEPRLQ